jgi:hypothetical protein
MNSKKSKYWISEAWVNNPSQYSKPEAANRLTQKWQDGKPGPPKNGNGLFGRRPTPDPYNPGCASGPRSVTVQLSQQNSDYANNTPRTIHEKFESNVVEKLVKKALNNQDVKKEYHRIQKRIEEGVHPINIGKKYTPVASNKVLMKGDEGRYLVEVSGNQVNVLGICARGNKKNVKSFENLMNEMYDVNLQY